MIQIRKADISELEAVYDIVRKSSQWMVEQYDFKHWDSYYTKERIAKSFATSIVYLLTENKKPVATYTLNFEKPYYYTEKDIAYFTEPAEKAIYPTKLAVLPKHHGKGYAKMLLSHLEQEAFNNGYKYIRFDARGDYSELINFYKKMGFIVVGRMDEEDGEYYELFEKKVAIKKIPNPTSY